jgi:hypothetical protein
MTLQYSVVVSERLQRARKVTDIQVEIANFTTREIMGPAQWEHPPASEYYVGLLFEKIRKNKGVRIRIPGDLPETLHSFVEARTKGSRLDLEISLLRGRDKLETLKLTGARVIKIEALGGSYLATLSLAGGALQDFEDKGLSYHIQLWVPNDSKGDTVWRDWNTTTHELAAEFTAQHISVPPRSPASEPLRNEVATGRLFQAIQARKELSILVRGGPGKHEQQATYEFLHAERSSLLYDVQILLHRETWGPARFSRLEVHQQEGHQLPVYEPTYESRKVYQRLAGLKLGNVQVREFLPIEEGAYVARLKVKGGAHAYDDVP